MFEIVNSLTESDRTSNYVALGNLVGTETNSYHSAFVIQHNSTLYEFHYTGENIEYNGLSRNYFHKISDSIHFDEVPAFIAHCKAVMKSANPKYGYFYSGESYDRSGRHFSNLDLGEIMTCVGFCLSILKGFLEEDYIKYTDWTKDSHDDDKYLDEFCSINNLDKKKISPSYRRITPRELLISGFYISIPIRKSEIDALIDEVHEYLTKKQKISNN